MKAWQAISVASISFVAAVTVHAEGLCAAKEAVIFNCELEKSISSLCQSTESGTLTYRNGSDGKINLQVSDEKRIKKDVFYFSNAPYAGGGEAHIRFSQFGYTYYLYDKTIKADEGPTFSAGIVVYKGGKRIYNLVCNNDASIREKAYQTITREKYRTIDVRQEK
ncbi:hypothetical protein KDW49_02280 [Burkholderia dolosa]|uniref:hypothetical protein n=1 Tax=Burkholderia dolosa TaxID=152500 RepID=UPI001B9DFC6F|nr:hypothetical protein [Burkholderia dolosa]MBR8299556.1 hypothetical protein [Burkholderia dolosa]